MRRFRCRSARVVVEFFYSFFRNRATFIFLVCVAPTAVVVEVFLIFYVPTQNEFSKFKI